MAKKKDIKAVDKVKKEKPAQYRATVVTMLTLMKEITLKRQHITELWKTPLWNLFNAFLKERIVHERKFDRVAE